MDKDILLMRDALIEAYKQGEITFMEKRKLMMSMLGMIPEWKERDKKDMDWDMYEKLLPEVFKAAEEYDKKEKQNESI